MFEFRLLREPFALNPAVREIIFERHLIAGAVMCVLAAVIVLYRWFLAPADGRGRLNMAVVVLMVLAIADFSAASVLVLMGARSTPFLGFSEVVAGVVGCLFGTALTNLLLPSEQLVETLSGRIRESNKELLGVMSERERLRTEASEKLDAYALRLRRLASIVEASPDPIIGINSDGSVWQWGRAAEALFGLGEDEVIGRSATDCLGSGLPALFDEVKRIEREESGSTQSVVDLRVASGELKTLWLSLARLPTAGEGASGWGINLRDISEKQRAEAAMEESLHEKEALLREVHHRVKNNLQLICSLLRLQSREVLDPLSLDMFRKSEERIRSLALVHEKLYQAEALARIPFGEYLHDLTAQIARAADRDGRVRIEHEIVDVLLPVDVAISVGLIVNEIFSFSMKHALTSGSEPCVVRVRLKVDRNTMVITISDSGSSTVGPELLGAPQSLGYRLVKSLSGQLKGGLSWEHNGEAHFVLSLPLGEGAALSHGVEAAA